MNVVVQMLERIIQNQQRDNALIRIDYAIVNLIMKIEVFDSKNISQFLRVYIMKMGSTRLS